MSKIIEAANVDKKTIIEITKQEASKKIFKNPCSLDDIAIKHGIAIPIGRKNPQEPNQGISSALNSLIRAMKGFKNNIGMVYIAINV